MRETIPEGRSLSARKRPRQDRSERMVRAILDATIALLKRDEGASIASITTNHIAREAGISVGSLYQYFPHKEAVFFRIFSEMLQAIREVLDSFKREPLRSMPREEFFDELYRRVKSAEADVSMVVALNHAMKIYPALVESDRRHAESIADDLAHFMKAFGSRWPMQKLRRLGLYIYYVNGGGWIYRNHVRPPRAEILEMETRTFNFLVRQCFDG